MRQEQYKVGAPAVRSPLAVKKIIFHLVPARLYSYLAGISFERKRGGKARADKIVAEVL